MSRLNSAGLLRVSKGSTTSIQSENANEDQPLMSRNSFSQIYPAPPDRFQERNIVVWLLSIVLATMLASQDVKAAEPARLDALKQKFHRPKSIPFPKDNPYTDAKAELGYTLFFDPRLSGENTMSCASCHNPALGWKDGLGHGVGHDAKQLARATPTILDLAWAELLMWDGRSGSLEDQATGPIEGAVEMNQPMPQLLAELAEIPGYRRMFREAFGRDEITRENLSQSIATFERTLVSNKAPFDRWIEGDQAAISESAKRGFVIFNGNGNCEACHSGWRFTDDGFHDIGLKSDDIGRGAQVPDEQSLQHAFKTPTLRNIDQRAPYMHDGSSANLRDVIVHYDTGFVERPSLSPEMHRLGLGEQEIDDLIEFMHTLTSRDDKVSVPVLPTKEQATWTR
jgi:cytochrome c peroxidase